MTEEEHYTDVDISDIMEDTEQYIDSEQQNTETIETAEALYSVQDSEPINSEDHSSTEKKPASASKSEVIRSTRLPIARVKNIMKMDPDVSVVSGDAVFLVTKATSGSRSRITLDQRRLMLDYIKLHPAINTGRFDGPEGCRVRARCLEELANILNSHGSGATKTPGKWLRSWQDWKSDVKKKAAGIARHARRPGVGPPISELTEMEKEMVGMIGQTSISGFNVPDQLEESSMPAPTTPSPPPPPPSPPPPTPPPPPPSPPPPVELEVKIVDEGDIVVPAEPASDMEDTQRRGRKRKSTNDSIDERMVEALERQSAATTEIAAQLGRQATAMAEIANTLGRLGDVVSHIVSLWVTGNNEPPTESIK